MIGDEIAFRARVRRIEDVAHDGFEALVAASGLDPIRDFRFARLQSQDFSGVDLNGFDFSGSHLVGSVFAGARIGDACFRGATLDLVALESAIDWSLALRARIQRELQEAPLPAPSLDAWSRPVDLRGHAASIKGALELVRGGILSWSSDGSARVWSLSGDCERVFRHPERPLLGASLLHDGRIVTWGGGGVRIWADGSRENATFRHLSDVVDVAQLSGAALLCLDARGEAFVWDFSQRSVSVVPGGCLYFRIARINSEKQALLGWGRTYIFAGVKLRRIRHRVFSFRGLEQFSDGKLIGWNRNHELCLIDRNGVFQRDIGDASKVTHGALQLRDTTMLAWNRDGVVDAWSEDGRLLWTCEAGMPIRDVMLSPNGDIRAWGPEGMCGLDVDGSAMGGILVANIRAIAQLEDGRLAVIGPNGAISVWSAQFEYQATLEPPRGKAKGALGLRDGRLLSWTDRELRIWPTSDAP